MAGTSCDGSGRGGGGWMSSLGRQSAGGGGVRGGPPYRGGAGGGARGRPRVRRAPGRPPPLAVVAPAHKAAFRSLATTVPTGGNLRRVDVYPADSADDRREVPLTDEDQPVLPDQTRDDTDRGWGER